MPLGYLIPSLEPKLRELYNAHLERAHRIDWAYHEYLPLDALRADPDTMPKLSPPVYTAVETALFTEVNLPWFTAGISFLMRGTLEVLQDFLHTWTAEEDQHAMLLETYLLLGDNGDHRQRAGMRKQIIRQGWTTDIQDPFEGMVYTAIQEAATQAFYLRVAAVCQEEDPRLARALRRIARDETLHMAFYRDAVNAHLEVEPNHVDPLSQIVMNFEMPGRGMPGFAERAAFMAKRNIYGPDHYYHMVIDTLWKYWGIDRLEPTLAKAREALKRLTQFHDRLAQIAARYAQRQRLLLTRKDTVPINRITLGPR